MAASLEGLGGLHGGGGPTHFGSAMPRLFTICESTCPLSRLYKELLLIRRGWPHESRNRQDTGMGCPRRGCPGGLWLMSYSKQHVLSGKRRGEALQGPHTASGMETSMARRWGWAALRPWPRC